MRTLIIGERFNSQGRDYYRLHEWHRKLLAGEMTPHEYVFCMEYCGAFKTVQNRARLAAIGLHVSEFSDGDTWAINLMPPAAQGESWPHALAARTAALVYGELDDELLVLCGARIREAFGYSHAEWFDWSERAVVVPHPSGLSRLWNDRAMIEKGRHVVERLQDVRGWTADQLSAEERAMVEAYVDMRATVDELPEPVRTRARRRYEQCSSTNER